MENGKKYLALQRIQQDAYGLQETARDDENVEDRVEDVAAVSYAVQCRADGVRDPAGEDPEKAG